MIHNKFSAQVADLQSKGASIQELKDLLGKGRAKKGMFLGDLDEGELEIGQVSSLIDKVLPVKDIMEEMVGEYRNIIQSFSDKGFLF